MLGYKRPRYYFLMYIVKLKRSDNLCQYWINLWYGFYLCDTLPSYISTSEKKALGTFIYNPLVVPWLTDQGKYLWGHKIICRKTVGKSCWNFGAEISAQFSQKIWFENWKKITQTFIFKARMTIKYQRYVIGTLLCPYMSFEHLNTGALGLRYRDQYLKSVILPNTKISQYFRSRTST